MTFKQLNENEVAEKSQFIHSPFPLINAVVSGEQQGKIFRDENNYFIIHKAGFSLLKTVSDDRYYDILHFMLQEKNTPPYFHIYDPPEQLVKECEQNDHINTKLRNRIQLKFTNNKSLAPEVALPENYSIEKITVNNFESLSLFGLDIACKFWNSKDDFLKNGFGFCVFNGQHEPVSICYTACLANNEAEIDIATVAAYQQKGLARAATTEFVNHCIKKKINANWDCFEDNYGSIKTAERIGFHQSYQYSLLSIFIK